MKRDEALRILAAHRDEFVTMGVRELAIFGSVARDEAGDGSDIDVIVVPLLETPVRNVPTGRRLPFTNGEASRSKRQVESQSLGMPHSWRILSRDEATRP